MAIPKCIVSIAKRSWHWQWKNLMNGLGPSDAAGNYQRPASLHQNSFAPLKEDILNRAKDKKPILIIGRSCPWAHRTWLVYELKNLSESINLHIALANQESGRWLLSEEILGCYSLLEVYKKCESNNSPRATVPVLIDPEESGNRKPIIMGNESAQLIETLNNWPTTKKSPDLAPKELLEEIDKWQNLIQESVNNGVYRCGFARNQNAYDKACIELFNALRRIEENLSRKGPWLCGEKMTLADIRLFPTLIRWESVYESLFKCRLRPLWTFPNLWEWRKRLFNIAAISKTCNSNTWRNDYFGALFPLNPSNIIPKGEDVEKIVNYNIPK